MDTLEDSNRGIKGLLSDSRGAPIILGYPLLGAQTEFSPYSDLVEYSFHPFSALFLAKSSIAEGGRKRVSQEQQLGVIILVMGEVVLEITI
jgi:hypothetical protein